MAAADVKKLVTDTAAQGAAQARKLMDEGAAQATKTAENVFKAAEEAAEFGRGNFEAVTKATQLYVAGIQDLGRQYFAVAQSLADQAMETAKALSTVKSLKEAADLQSTLARTTVEKTMAESVKLQEATLKLAEQSMAPITARVTLAVEKFGRPLAA